ncbi:hypothetical protein AQUSIP_08780 [Aquicella siphonis]|uniref:Uncharacterized protein n=1 Tax=Aquicella siphonis TaxID=254247 RepID=A0A5E4PGE3_9COXI|nr:hypothetical protein [Aquicella siphonis]VVC75588.1 hypothetical protein AQUSIP_08780 [Aquicella siphonis]
MKKYCFTILLIPSLAYAAGDNAIFDDHTWYIGNHSLRVNKHEPFPFNGQIFDHTVAYVTPDGMHGSSDACRLSSSDSISCYSGDRVTYQADAHSATLSGRFISSYTYYDKDHVPEANPLSAAWQRVPSGPSLHCRNGDLVRMVIPYHEKDATRLRNIERYFMNNGYSSGDTYYLVKNSTSGHIALSPLPNQVYYSAFYLYDSNGNPITDFSKLDTLAMLNDSEGKFDPLCNLVKSR